MTDNPGEVQDENTTTEEQDENDTPPPPELREPGQKALDSMKARVKAAREIAAKAQARVAELEASATDPAEIEKRVRAEVAQEQLTERTLDKIETKAAKLFEDPDVARALLERRAGEFVKDGKIDEAAIMKALEGVLEAKPYLAARAGKRFVGSADGGARNAQSETGDMNTLLRRAAGIS